MKLTRISQCIRNRSNTDSDSFHITTGALSASFVVSIQGVPMDTSALQISTKPKKPSSTPSTHTDRTNSESTIAAVTAPMTSLPVVASTSTLSAGRIEAHSSKTSASVGSVYETLRR